MRVDVVVVGKGPAGIAAARAAREAGATVAMVAHGPSALSSGSGLVWGAARSPFDRWNTDGAFRLGGRYITLAGWVVTDALAALRSLLDLSALSPERPVGVVDLETHPSWSARYLAHTLGGKVVRAADLPTAESFREVAARLDTEGIAEGVGVKLREAAVGCGGLLFPPVLGLRRDDVAERIARVAGMPVGEVAGMPGDPTGYRIERAITRWIPSDVRVHHGEATVQPGSSVSIKVRGIDSIATRAVVLATGGLASGGTVFDHGLREPCAHGTLWSRRERVPDAPSSVWGFDPMEWFQDVRGRASTAALRVDDAHRMLNPDGDGAWCPWLFAAGDVAGGAHGEGIAGALRAGQIAGERSARHALG